MDSYTAKNKILSRKNKLSKTSLQADYDARQAVMLSMTVFLGLDLLRTTEEDPNRNEFLRSIAKWSMPGLAVLLKNCVIARKQLRKEAFSKEVRHRPFVVELIGDDIFIDTLFSTSTVERIKNQR